MKLLDTVKTLLAPLVNLFTFNLQDSIKGAAKNLMQSLFYHDLEEQANAIVQSNQMMELCAMVDTFMGVLIALFTLCTTIVYLLLNWELIKPKFTWIVHKWQAFKTRWIRCNKQKL